MGFHCWVVYSVPAAWGSAVPRMAILMNLNQYKFTKADGWLYKALIAHLEDYIALMDYFTVPESDSVKSRARALLSECRKGLSCSK